MIVPVRTVAHYLDRNSRYFGVPQRRRRVFILGARADGDPRGSAERAGEILAVGSRCQGILRRAQRRGKTLPDHLEAALRTVAGRETTSTGTGPT